jgi:hypothetical protein
MDSRTDWIGFSLLDRSVASELPLPSLARPLRFPFRARTGRGAIASIDRPTDRPIQATHSLIMRRRRDEGRGVSPTVACPHDRSRPPACRFSSPQFLVPFRSGLPPPPQLCLLLGATVHDPFAKEREGKKTIFCFTHCSWSPGQWSLAMSLYTPLIRPFRTASSAPYTRKKKKQINRSHDKLSLYEIQVHQNSKFNIQVELLHQTQIGDVKRNHALLPLTLLALN